MSQTNSPQVRSRSPLGQIFKWGFIGFNILMVLWLVHGIGAVSHIKAGSEAARAGKAIGATLGFAMILGIWVVGDIILGICVLLTRGERVPVQDAPRPRSQANDALTSTMDADAMIARYLERKQAEERPRASAPPAGPSGFGRRR